MNSFGIGLLGFGTVGAGVVEGLQRHADLIEARTGIRLALRRVADLDVESDRGVRLDPGILTTDAHAVINDPAVDIIVELIGGTTIAKAFTLKALGMGKSVVTANKALLAEEGADIYAAAAASGANLYYEASVAGGIPIIKALRESLVGNQIESIYGILNGTCNYILTRMEREQIAFDVVLKAAQEAGFAEAEPSLDIDGRDTAHKACILAGLAFGRPVAMDEVFIEGIRGIAAEDINYALEMGYRIKLLAIIKKSEGQIEVRVHPTLIPAHAHMLGSVDGVFNAVLVHGDIVGETMYYGKGAGRLPTASAVIADLVDVARNLQAEAPDRMPAQLDHDRGAVLRPVGEIETRYYLRLSLLDKPGVLGQVTETLGRHGISIASVVQKEIQFGEQVPVIFLTQRCQAQRMQQALDELSSKGVVGGDAVKIIIEDLD